VHETTSVLLPDRPGNRLADGLRNVLRHLHASLAVLVPGESRVLALSGSARLTDDDALLRTMAVSDKTPKLATCIAVTDQRLLEVPGLARARIWDPSTHLARSQLPTFGRMIVEQMTPSTRLEGLRSSLIQALLSHDERKRLY
jgi:hypothetical protein